MRGTDPGADAYRALVEGCADALVAWGPDGVLTVVNTAAARLCRRDPHELVGRPLVDLVVAEDRDALGTARRRVSAGEVLAEQEVRVAPVGADPVPVAAGLFALPDVAAGAGGAVLRDLTAWHATQAARGAALERQSQIERLESIGRLAGGIAHDFNNLMAVILNYASFVAQQVAEDPVASADVEQIRDAATRGAHLTRQLLLLGRREPVRLEVLDLNALVADVAALLAAPAGDGVELTLELADGVPPVRTGRRQLEHVLLNLVTNACESMPGGGTVTVRTGVADLDEDHDALGPQRAPGRYACLSVIDTGEGMSAETVDLAFEPFFTTKPRAAATGLGLATVYGIMADAGGLVELSSEEGRGTTVQLFVPVAGPEDQTPPAAPPVPDAGSSGVVLLVEDEDAMRKLTARILRRNGFGVLEAATGGEALRLAEDDPPDLLLTDVIMPEMSGEELAEQLRARHRELPVLFMSGFSAGALSADGVLDGAVELLEKPFDEQALVGRVRSLLPPPTG